MFETLRNLLGLGLPASARSGIQLPNSFPTTQMSGYQGGRISRMIDFQASMEAAHKEIQRDLLGLRSHSRELFKNNAYLRRYADMVSTHVVGPEGIAFESDIRDNQNKPKEDLNNEIERAWSDWGRCVSVDGKLSWIEFQQLAAQTAAVDGEVFIRKVRNYPNAYRFALELIDPDRVDWTYNQAADAQGVRVIMGVEVDSWGKPLAYHVWSAHPYDYEARPVRKRIPAEEIIHLFRHERARSTRGIPWATPVMVQANMLGRLWSSELAAANIEADRIGIIKSQAGVPLDDIDSDPADVAAEMQSDVCTFMGLDPGQDIVFPQLQHPNTAFPEFTRALLKGIAAGLGVSYHSLAADVSDANYSSARVALLEERDTWRRLQHWFVAQACDEIFHAWLPMALLTGGLKVPVQDPDRICVPKWWPRSWDWVDPMKDVQASILAIRAGLSTYQEELGAMGRDWRETFRQRAEEEEFQRELGLKVELDSGKANPAAPGDPASPESEAAATGKEKADA